MLINRLIIASGQVCRPESSSALRPNDFQALRCGDVTVVGFLVD